MVLLDTPQQLPLPVGSSRAYLQETQVLPSVECGIEAPHPAFGGGGDVRASGTVPHGDRGPDLLVILCTDQGQSRDGGCKGWVGIGATGDPLRPFFDHNGHLWRHGRR